MTDTNYKQPHGFMPGFDGRTDRERELDAANEVLRRRAVAEKIRIFFARSENRRIARRNEIHAEALACNIDFDRRSL